MARPAAVLLVLLAWAQPAAGQDDPVESAWASYRGAEFRVAIDALDHAEARGAISAEDYPRSLEIRALAAHALGDGESAHRTLRLLAAVAPDYVLGPEAVPELRETLDAERAAAEGRVRLDVDAEADGTRVTIDARVTRDALGVVRRLDVLGRAGEDGSLTRAEEHLELEAGDAPTVAYYVEAIGPAGRVVARAGTPAHPRYLELDTGGPGTGFWIAVLAGGAALIAAGVVATLVLTRDDDVPVDITLPF